MNVLQAARDTLKLAKEHGMNYCDVDEESLNYAHLAEMVEAMAAGDMSYGKQCRWLGWIQAAVVSFSVAGDTRITLDQMKEINKRHAGD